MLWSSFFIYLWSIVCFRSVCIQIQRSITAITEFIIIALIIKVSVTDVSWLLKLLPVVHTLVGVVCFQWHHVNFVLMQKKQHTFRKQSVFFFTLPNCEMMWLQFKNDCTTNTQHYHTPASGRALSLLRCNSVLFRFYNGVLWAWLKVILSDRRLGKNQGLV